MQYSNTLTYVLIFNSTINLDNYRRSVSNRHHATFKYSYSFATDVSTCSFDL